MNTSSRPISSTAMAAATQICIAYITPPETAQAWEDIRQDVARKIDSHFQPLLAKVEGERDAAREKVKTLEKMWHEENAKKDEARLELTTLRADPAAAKAMLKTCEETVAADKLVKEKLWADLAAKDAVLGEMIVLATQEAWNTPLYVDRFGEAVRAARSAHTSRAAGKGEAKKS